VLLWFRCVRAAEKGELVASQLGLVQNSPQAYSAWPPAAGSDGVHTALAAAGAAGAGRAGAGEQRAGAVCD